jgi:hypothetical protein
MIPGMRQGRESPVRRIALACALVVASGTLGARRARAEGRVVAEGTSCQIVSHGVGQATVDACRDALDGAKKLLDEVLPWPQAKDERLVIHVYAEVDDFAAAMRAADAEDLVDNRAATLYSTKESHVVFSPRMDGALVEFAGPAPDYTVWQIVHEAVHQRIAHADLPSYTSWPQWLEEGVCEWVAERAVAARQPAGRVSLPAEDRAHLMRDALVVGRFLGLERLLHTRVQQFRPERVAYAHAWSLVRMLAEDKTRLRALLGKFGGFGEPAGTAYERQRALEPRAAAALADVYGPLGPLEARWKEAVKKAAPSWYEPIRSGQWLSNDRLLTTAFPKGGAQVISTQPPPAGPYVVRTTLRLLPLGETQADVYLAFEGRQDARFLKVAFGAEGYVTLLAFAAGCWQDRYRVSRSVPVGTFPPDADVAVAVRVDSKTIRVEVGGKSVLEADVPPGYDLVHGGWGVGAWDSAVVWGAPSVTSAK